MWQNAGVQLSGYLWKQNNEPYVLPEQVFPQEKMQDLYQAVIFPEQEQLIEAAKKNHPELAVYNFKLNALVVERKLKFQELLPKIDLKYNQLGKGYDLASTATKTLFDNNYRYGISFSMPLRLSSGRGEYKMAKLKQHTYKKNVAILVAVDTYFHFVLGAEWIGKFFCKTL